MKLRHLSILVLLLLVPFLFAACATTQTTPDTKVLYMYRVFNAQYADYLSMAKNPNLTDQQKQIMRKKKKILSTLQLLIPLYDAGVQAGAPNPEQEQQIYDFINQLQLGE